ncbi:MAG: patatin-like phospholipase family protein [Parafilimonas sp.]|nr:patatin-like phospholipase family protein [Parafilimonas sp.]
MSYKILSLDGGGSWALIQARVLKDIYGDMGGHALLRNFDLAIANSGGSLVLACLCNDMKLSEVINVFQDETLRKKVFSVLTFFEKLKAQDILALFRSKIGIGPKYSTTRKLEGLTKVLTDYDHLYREGKVTKPIVQMTMDELPSLINKQDLQIVIVGFDYFRQRVSFFRSNMLSKTDKFSSRYFAVPLAHAIHASSNAPLNYFDAPAAIQSYIKEPKPTFAATNYNATTWFWDGAVSGFNNPVLAGLIEAITNGADAKDCCILSLGTGTGSRVIITDKSTSSDPDDKSLYAANKNNPLAKADVAFSFKNDLTKMATSILADPPDSATFMAYSMIDPSLTNKANIIRINPCYSPVLDAKTNTFVVPDAYKNDANAVQKLLTLIDMDMDAVENGQVDLIKELCDKFIIDTLTALPNQLIRGNVSGTYLGDATYAAAKARWNQCI